MTDPKQGEREYFARIGPEGLAYARRKPFVPGQASLYLSNFAALLYLLPPPPQRILEFGCGTGWLSLLLAEVGYDVTGVDISADAIEAARDDAARRNLTRLKFELADYEAFSSDQPFDFVIFYDALHHAESELDALSAAYRALRPGGAAITIEPGAGHGDSAESREAVKNFGVHEKDMPPTRIISAARCAGFKRHLVLPRPFDVNRTFYRAAFHRATSRLDLFGLRFLAFARFLPRFLRPRTQGLVILWK